MALKKEDDSISLNQSLGIAMNNSSSTTSGSTDFVKKLFLMLEDNSYENIVRWTHKGDSFVVLDTNEFTKEILPRHFKHSNFASFVRQLNKYDFHKVKMTPEEKQQNEYGESAWEFKHPDFKRHDREALESIKRKGPVQKRAASSEEQSSEVVNRLEDTVLVLQKENKALLSEMKAMNQKYTTVIESIINMKNTNDRYFRSINTLVRTLMNQGIKVPQLDLPPIDAPVSLLAHPPQQPQQQQQQTGIRRAASGSAQGGGAQPPQTQPTTASQSPKPNNNLRSGFHVLLVEDDNVCIQLCRKFLEKYGCTVEVVSDGLTAINALEKSRYDIVLMDIIMPNLDGATATSIVRSFDNRTPIIAMTGNIDDQDLVTYLQHGMSDILAKPFTKDDLYLMLEKHLSSRTPLAYQQATGVPVPVPVPVAGAELVGGHDDGGPLGKRQKI
jgi:osomolarity two-component system response regulator SKN7